MWTARRPARRYGRKWRQTVPTVGGDAVATGLTRESKMSVALALLAAVVGALIGWLSGHTRKLWGGVVTLVGFGSLIWFALTTTGNVQRALAASLAGFAVGNIAGGWPHTMRALSGRRLKSSE